MIGTISKLKIKKFPNIFLSFNIFEKKKQYFFWLEKYHKINICLECYEPWYSKANTTYAEKIGSLLKYFIKLTDTLLMLSTQALPEDQRHPNQRECFSVP